MTKPWRMAVVLSAIALGASMLVAPLFMTTVSAGATGTRAGTLTFTVGGQDQMKTLNYLPAIANDVWTSDVLDRVYDTVGQTDPNTDALVPYILKGIDVNGDGNFERTEKAVFLKATCPAPCADPTAWRRTIVAYYDFNGVHYQDGVQVTIGDIFFNYVLQSLNPRFNTNLRVLWDDPNAASLPPTRHLNVYPMTGWGGAGGAVPGCGPTDTQWQGALTMPGDNNLRCAVRFQLQDDFALFYRSTLAGLTLFPRHVYEATGYPAGHHADWGRAIYPESNLAKFGQGIPIGETAYTPLDYSSIDSWQMTNGDVIGTGPFRFVDWQFGQFAKVEKNPDYYYGVNNTNPTQVFDPDVSKYMHPPFIDAIVFKIYRTTQLGVLALQSGDIDFYHWNLPPEFVPPLLNSPATIRVWANAEPGFFYLSYNMRRQPFGYTTYPPPPGLDREPTTTGSAPCPTCVDAGYYFRQAFAHLIDKPTIIRTLLQNYGVVADGVMSPANTFWYNGSLPQYTYSPSTAAAMFDAQGWTVDPATGWRNFPRIGEGVIQILTPQADYDPIRASAGAMIAAAARSIGVNAQAVPTAFGAIINDIDARDFDMFILGWRIGGTDPDYMFSFFHSSNAASGQNYPGFYDTTFDNVIMASRKELNEGTRQQLAKWAQGILSERLPYDVLYYRTNVEAQRVDRYVNFSVASGTIWNYWSLMGIRPPSNKNIRAVLTTPSAIVQGGTTPVTVTVRDQDQQPVNGAQVTLSVDRGSGNFTAPPAQGVNCPDSYTCVGVTGSTGTFTATYRAPATVPPNPDVVIQVVAKSPDPDVPTDTRSRVITVFQAGVPFLSITPQLTTGDLVPTKETLVFGIDVKDQDGNLANSAHVEMTVSPTSATLTPTNGSASTLRSNIQFKAPNTIAESPTTFSVNVDATLTGYQSGQATIEFTVVVVTTSVTCPDGSTAPDISQCPQQFIPALGLIPVLAVIAVAAVAYTMMKRKKQRRRSARRLPAGKTTEKAPTQKTAGKRGA